MLVVDTNVIAYLYIQGDKSPEVETLLRFDPVWMSPILWRSEFLNVLCTYHRIEKMAISDCTEAFELADDLLRERSYYTVPLKVIEMSSRTGCAGYDSEFLSLADELSVKLVTYDQKLIANSGGLACTPSTYMGSA